MDTNRSSANGDGAANRNEHAGIGDNTAENIYAQAMRTMYEQQLAAMSSLSAAAANPAASLMAAGYNPLMMAAAASPYAGLGAFSGLGAAAGMAGLGGINATDYQTALAAAMTSGFPAAALYSSMGYGGGMPFSASDYASVLSAYSASMTPASVPSALTALDTMNSAAAERTHTSPALSQCNRSSTGRAQSSSRQSTPQQVVSSSVQHENSRQRKQQNSRENSPAKKPRLSNTNLAKDGRDKPKDHTAANFFDGLTAEELDVNTHFKNSLGSLYNTPAASIKRLSPHTKTTMEHPATSTTPDGCLDLSLKKTSDSPASTTSSVNNHQERSSSAVYNNQEKSSSTVYNHHQEKPSSSTPQSTANLSRKSVIQTVPKTTSNQSNYNKKLSSIDGQSFSSSAHSTSSSSCSSKSLATGYKKGTTRDSPASSHNDSNIYDALPNLKRLSEQLKTDTSCTPSTPSTTSGGSTKSKHVVSLLKHQSAPSQRSADSKVARVRKGKQQTLKTQDADIREKERNEIIRKLQHEVKPGSTSSQSEQRNFKPPKSRRKNIQKPRAGGEDLEIASPSENDQPKQKRPYIRTKISQDKPVDMAKLGLPFDYGWRRETRLRGINKNGRMIGEVFYYTPTDKRMRSWNDVSKYLKHKENLHRTGQKEEMCDEGDDDDSCKEREDNNKADSIDQEETTKDNTDCESLNDSLVIDEETSPAPKPKTDHSIAKITGQDQSQSTSTTATTETLKVPVSPNIPATIDTLLDVDNDNSLPNGVLELSEVKPAKPEETDTEEKKDRPHEWVILTKDHFSFSTKVKLGDFMEQKPGEKYILLNDAERDQRINTANEKRNKQLEKLNKIKNKKIAHKEAARKLEQAKIEKQRKQMEIAQRALQQKLKKQLDKARSKAQHELMKQQRAMAMQMRKQQLLEERERERMQKQERNKYLLEEKERKLRELKEQKAQKRLAKAMMRERQRQSLINSKIMENRKREEERRRHYMEKIVQKERRAEIKKREAELARELKQPAEDLMLPNIKPLPELNRITGLKVPADVFANVLQLHQFLTNFYNCLEIKQSIPSLNTFQQALLCENKSSEQAVSKILCHMLTFALNDPGVQFPSKFMNEIGQKVNLSNLKVDDHNFSEILRMFMLDRDDKPTKLSQELEVKPFSSLSMHLKSESMAWLCDELNTSQAVTGEIENNLESVLNLRRDKWELEGKIRELKSSSQDAGKPAQSSKNKDLENSDQSDNDDDENDTSEATKKASDTNGEKSADSVDEKKLEKLTKQYHKCCKDVVSNSSTVRTFPLGMDRYRRYYWCLPSFKGVLVESSESSVHPTACGKADIDLRLAEVKTESKMEVKSESHDTDTTKAAGVISSDDTKHELSDNKDLKTEPELSVTDGAAEIKAEHIEKEEKMDVESALTSLPANEAMTSLPPTSVTDSPKSNSDLAMMTSVTKDQIPRPNGRTNSPHSIASWLSSTIDNILIQQNSSETSQSPSSSAQPVQHAQPITSHHTITTQSGDVKNIIIPSQPLPTASAYIIPTNTDDQWFELSRKMPCDRLEKTNTQLIANSLAFMNCASGSEEQRELEAIEKLAAKASLLDQPRELPTDVQRGWWLISEADHIKSVSSSLHTRAIRERLLNRALNKHKERLETACNGLSFSADVTFDTDGRDKEIADSPYRAPLSEKSTTWKPHICRNIELKILDKVEDLEERVYQASIYTKNWADKKKHDATDLDLVETPVSEVKDGEKRIIDLVKEKLLLLEAGIERRYLKPPFIKSAALQLADIVSSNRTQNGTSEKQDDGSGSDSESDDGSEQAEESCSKGLLQWQRAVRGAVSLSQLYLALQQLESCIAWEKSVMRVLCQVCRSDDNEDQLLLCDSCDKGYHTYCFKPKMTNIPDGDWYCWECKSKATSVAHCIRCGKSTGKMAQCHRCPQAIHLDCCSPTLQRVPRKHTCGHCLRISNQRNGKSKAGRRSLKQEQEAESSDDEDKATNNSTSEEEESAEEKEEEPSNENDITICSQLMAEVEKHKDAKPFLEPVDTKAFPQYKKYIKHPMDLGKVANKLCNNEYTTRTEFYDDMILIFDNCLLFNEDNSDVGKSGKAMRRLFLKRWKQLTD